ncbi:MAG TPA: dicarboxylate/amino acid:cation symporter [Fimbriimonadaceae bacterium]|nr:dicarboxylate/amino acid:cation symporter [Fimbriimonadaceae bacterium]
MRALKSLYVQVLIGVALGIVVGAAWPHAGASLKPLGDGFIKLIKMIIAPIVFCTVTSGIAHMGDMRRFGRIGVKALVYFETVSTLALLIGLAVGEFIGPGRGFGVNPATLDASKVTEFVHQAQTQTVATYLLHIIPDTFVGAFANGDLLQVVFLALLSGFALTRMGSLGDQIMESLDKAAQFFFSLIGIVVKAAPVGAFGAMAFTIGMYGTSSLARLGALIGTFYLTAILFVVIALGLIARIAGFSVFRFISYIREELLVVLGTSSSETVLPQLMRKLERLGVSPSVVGLVVPTGYSFNLDGTNIYMTLATLFLAQATNTHLTAAQVATLLVVAMLTSKGASGVTGSGFVTLAATLSAVPTIPVASLALVIGVDRFMSECRALTNTVGNGVATIVVARWDKALDRDALARELKSGPREEVAAAA